jgi:hypothetical protein
MIIQTTELPLSGPTQIEATPNVSSENPTGSSQFGAELLPRN